MVRLYRSTRPRLDPREFRNLLAQLAGRIMTLEKPCIFPPLLSPPLSPTVSLQPPSRLLPIALAYDVSRMLRCRVSLVQSSDVEVRGLVVHAEVLGHGVPSPEEDRQLVFPHRFFYAGKICQYTVWIRWYLVPGYSESYIVAHGIYQVYQVYTMYQVSRCMAL